jgi:hypothetical protein
MSRLTETNRHGVGQHRGDGQGAVNSGIKHVPADSPARTPGSYEQAHRSRQGVEVPPSRHDRERK